MTPCRDGTWYLTKIAGLETRAFAPGLVLLLISSGIWGPVTSPHYTTPSLQKKKKKKMGLYQCQGQQAPEGNKMSGNQALDLALHDSGGSPSPPGLHALC